MSRSRPARKSASHLTSRPGIILPCRAAGFIAGAGHRGRPTGRPVPATSDENAQARRWFKDAKFGLFIHWGVYSLLGKGEWVMDHDKLPIAEYAKLPPRFNPTRFDAEAWVKLAKSAGARYITITAKHHDGFCMFASKLDRLRHRRRHALPCRPAQGAGRRLPSREDQALLLLLAARLAPSRLFPRGQDRANRRPAGEAETGSGMSRITRDRSASSAPTTARSAASGSTAGGTSPTPIGTWRAPTG